MSDKIFSHVVVQDLDTGQYVLGWEADRKSFTFTPHKGLAQTWTSEKWARAAVLDAVNKTGRMAIVSDETTEVERAVAYMLSLSAKDRKEVARHFCYHCWEDNPGCCCRNDE